MRLYLDSNVLISYIRSEIDGSFNILYKDSENFFSVCSSAKFELVISEFFLEEVGKKIFLEEKQINEILDSLGVKIVFFGKPDKEKAKQILKETGLHKADAVHVANAVESESSCIITWNKKDFEKVGKIIPCYTPKEFIQDIF